MRVGFAVSRQVLSGGKLVHRTECQAQPVESGPAHARHVLGVVNLVFRQKSYPVQTFLSDFGFLLLSFATASHDWLSVTAPPIAGHKTLLAFAG